MTVTFFEDVGTMATRDHKIIIWIIWLLIRLICKSTEGRGLEFIENLDFFQIKVGRESPFWNFAWDKMQENSRITDFLKCFYFLFLFFYGQRKQNGRYLGIKISGHSVTKANVCIRRNMEKNRWNICDIWALGMCMDLGSDCQRTQFIPPSTIKTATQTLYVQHPELKKRRRPIQIISS